MSEQQRLDSIPLDAAEVQVDREREAALKRAMAAHDSLRDEVLRLQGDVAVGCMDCGLPYGDPGFADLFVPHDVWAKISPTGDEGGILCPTCMVRAAVKAGVETSAIFRSGPFFAENP